MAVWLHQVALPVLQGVVVCIHRHFGGCRLRMALRQARPAWHALSSGKSTVFYKEQVGKKAQHCRAHCAAVRGGIPLKRVGAALKINSLK